MNSPSRSRLSLRTLSRWVCVVAVLSLAACASAPTSTANPKDPWEPMNRRVASFNDALDDNVVKPVARTYRNTAPELVQTGVRNFFGNLSDLWSAVNSGLQLKGRDAAESFMRVVVNSTVGIYGLIDVATPIGLERHNEDFGQTLGYWGVPDGPYVVLPLFGPSTLRDTASLPADMNMDPVRKHDNMAERNTAWTLRTVQKRGDLLKTSDLLGEASIDKYSFTRDAYLQFRRAQIYDGNPPEEDEVNPDAPAPR